MDKTEQKAQNVIAMSEFKNDTGFTAIAQIEGYWDALRGTRLMPKRSEIDPRGIESALEFTFVLERIAPGMARLRIAGSHLSDLMGMEVRGMPLTSFVSPGSRRQLSDAMEEVFQRPAVCELRLSAETGRDKPPMDARLILLPLKSDLGDVSRILGCLVARGDVGRAPRRFEIIGARMRPITSVAEVPSEMPKVCHPAEPAVSQDEVVPGFAETKPRFAARPSRTDVPYLRLVKTDE